ncbi:MAG: hypothetical protein WBA28_01155 [Microbacteriaceae bacterium]
MAKIRNRRPHYPSRLIASALVLSVLSASGCAMQSRESLNEFVDVLRADPSVATIDFGVSTPLPGAVHSSPDVTFKAGAITAATMNAFNTLACNTPVNASVNLRYYVPLGNDVDLQISGGGSCLPDYALGFTEALPVLSTYEGEFDNANWNIRGYDEPSVKISIRMDAQTRIASMNELATFASDIMASQANSSQKFTLEMFSKKISLEISDQTATEAQQAANMIAILAEEFGLSKASYNGKLFLQLSPDEKSTVHEISNFLALNYQKYAGADILSGQLNSEGNQPSAETIDFAELLSTKGFGTELAIKNNVLYLQVLSVDDVIAVAKLAEANGYNPQNLSYTVNAPANLKILLGRDAGVLLESANLPRVKVLSDALQATGKVKAITFRTEGVQVWLAEQYYDDSSSFDQVKSVLQNTVKSAGLSPYIRYMYLNNKEL